MYTNPNQNKWFSTVGLALFLAIAIGVGCACGFDIIHDAIKALFKR